MTTLIRFYVESAGLMATRITLGDEKTAELLSKQEYDPEFVKRHSNQIESILSTVSEQDE